MSFIITMRDIYASLFVQTGFGMERVLFKSARNGKWYVFHGHTVFIPILPMRLHIYFSGKGRHHCIRYEIP